MASGVVVPSNVAARSFGCENIVLTWEHATNASYYYIETSPDSESAWTVMADGLHGSTTVVPAPIDSSNYYRVVAVLADGATSASDALVASPAPLGVPENLTATAFERLAVQLNWIAPAIDEFPLYAIERSLDDGATWTTVAENYAGTNSRDRSLTLGETASYRVSIITQKTTQSYSRYYDNMNRGVVSGSQSGYAANDRTERTAVAATVYYNPAQYRTFYVGSSTVNKKVERSYSGSGSYTGAGTDRRSSSYSESGSSETSTRTTTIFDQGISASWRSVDHTGLEIVDSTYSYSRSETTASDESEHDSITETSHTQRDWNYKTRRTSGGEIVSYGNTWTGTSSGEVSNSYLDPWFDYVPVETLYTESYSVEIDCSLTKLASSATPTSSAVLTSDRDRNYVQIWHISATETEEEALDLDPINPNAVLTSFSPQGNNIKYCFNSRFALIDSYEFQNYGTNSDPYNPKTPTSDLIRIPGDGSFNLFLSLPNFYFIDQPECNDSEWEALSHDFIADSLLPEETRNDIDSILDSMNESISVKDMALLALNSAVNALTIAVKTYIDLQLLEYRLAAKAIEFVYDVTLRESVELAKKSYSDMKATGAGGGMAFLVAAGVFCADQTGVVNISNAVEGEDLATGRQLSTGERVFQGVILLK